MADARRQALRHICATCGNGFLSSGARARYCSQACRPRRRRTYEQNRRRNSTERGYGAAHQSARRAALARLRDGDPCARCGGPMFRAQSRSLDLDHADDRRSYRGLAHAICNRKAGGRRGADVVHGRSARPQRTVPAPSREW